MVPHYFSLRRTPLYRPINFHQKLFLGLYDAVGTWFSTALISKTRSYISCKSETVIIPKRFMGFVRHGLSYPIYSHVSNLRRVYCVEYWMKFWNKSCFVNLIHYINWMVWFSVSWNSSTIFLQNEYALLFILLLLVLLLFWALPLHAVNSSSLVVAVEIPLQMTSSAWPIGDGSLSPGGLVSMAILASLSLSILFTDSFHPFLVAFINCVMSWILHGSRIR